MHISKIFFVRIKKLVSLTMVNKNNLIIGAIFYLFQSIIQELLLNIITKSIYEHIISWYECLNFFNKNCRPMHNNHFHVAFLTFHSSDIVSLQDTLLWNQTYARHILDCREGVLNTSHYFFQQFLCGDRYMRHIIVPFPC